MSTLDLTLIGQDPVENPSKWPQFVQRFFLLFIREKRDVAIFSALVRLSVLMPSAAALIYLFPGNLYPVLFYFVCFLAFLGPYTLMLHNMSHRPTFKPGFGFFNVWAHAVLGIFFGHTPGTYYTHHIGMHHPENNMDEDLSSTIRYKRDNFLHFLHYYITFNVFGIVTLSAYFIRKKRYNFLVRTIVGELCWFALVAGVWMLNSWAAIFVLIVPVLATRFLLMAGNWTQHAFVDAEDPENPYLNSISFIDSVYNKRCFNDGYHIGHHVNAGRHFLDMPNDFIRNLKLYKKHKAIVFRKLDYFIIWFLLMTHSYTLLARYFVDLGDKKMSKDEIIALMKSRVLPIHAT